MNFYVNEIIVDCIENKTYRILWIHDSQKFLFLIDINDVKALPILKEIKELQQDIVEEVKYKEKNIQVRTSDGQITKKAFQIREAAYEIIKDIIAAEPEIYFSDSRGKLIKNVLKETNTTKPTIYKYLRRYWQRGKTINGLIPDYCFSGGKGKKKELKVKNGRRGKFNEFTSNVIVNDEIRRIFSASLNSFYFNTKKNSLPHTYKMMIRKFFVKDTYFENGVKKVILIDKKNIPTIDQLRYYLKTEYTEKKKTITRLGKINYEQNFRDILGSSTFETLGPGSRFQIDATIADVYIVSQYNSDWIIGRPVVYFVVDVFSRMIVGLYVGLEGPSWLGGMMALANTVSDKQLFCKEYGIEIEKEQWPCEYLPEILLADRGEFEGYNVERLNDAFNLHVENAAPYRPDWKGIVEKYFDVFQGRVKPFIPGYVEKDFKQRGATDYRLNATLTLKEFTKIIIAEVLYHNNHHYIMNYPRDKDMINDKLHPIPINIWNWGVNNRSGKLTYHTPDSVKLNLLPHANATVTERGIRFNKKLLYYSDKAMKENWFSTARIKGSWKVKVAYDPRDMNQIYLLNNNNSSFETCMLLDHIEGFKNSTVEDINFLIEQENYDNQSYKYKQIKEEINLINQVEEIVKSSLKKNQDKSNSLSKKEKIGSISFNKSNEKEKLRKLESFHLNDGKHIDNLPVDKDIANTTDKVYERKSIKDLLKQKGNW